MLELTGHIDENGTLKIEDMYKQIEGFPNYMIGRNGTVLTKNGALLKTQLNNRGYVMAHLHHKGQRKAFTVHRLVGIYWVPNPDNLPQLNHLDGNKQNNNDWNLSWSSASDNIKHSFEIGLSENTRASARERMRALGSRTWANNIDILIAGNIQNRKPVIQMDLQGNDLREFESVKAARKATGNSNVGKVLNGTYEQSKGYKWRWK